MALNVAQICQAKYPGQVEKFNITFKQTDSDLLIDQWNVEGIPRPSESDLLEEASNYEGSYKSILFSSIGTLLVEDHINSTAQSRKYKDGVHCASYTQSTNASWAAEAQAFIAWRDSIYAYAIEQLELINNNQRPIPTEEEFKNELPIISWPF